MSDGAEREPTASDANTIVLDAEGALDARTSTVGPSRPSVEYRAGESLGRYVVLETVGQGSMGRVLRAYDPKLLREVALKLVSGKVLDDSSRQRMLREAQTMAQLSHPNVVAVYDVEEVGSGVMLVMEYVAGQTLRQWVKSGTHHWSEVVARFVEAGRGLVAAHDAGLLHRDFKAENVLVATSGAVKVTDFGLAKLAATSTPSTPDVLVSASVEVSSSSAALDSALTHVGVVMGTPRYMAPEQHRGEALDSSADQYAFCVSLWEALCDEPPHQAKSLRELLTQKLRDPPAWPAQGAGVARGVVDAIVRGLAAQPRDRWPSMDALLDVLARDPDARRNRWLRAVGGLGLLGLLGAGWASWAAARADRCSGADAQLKGAWGSQARSEVQSAMLGLGVSFAQDTWQRTEVGLDRYADRWVAMHREACEATTVRGEQSASVMDLRMGCLHRARVEFDAVVRVLSQSDARVTQHADDLVEGLPALERCADVVALQAEVEPPRPEDAEAVRAVERLLADAKVERQAGRYDQAHQQVEQASAAAAGIEYGPVKTLVALEEGLVLAERGRYSTSVAALRRALESGARWRQWEAMQSAAEGMLLVVGYRQQRIEAGRQLWELALGLAQGDPRREASARDTFAQVLGAQGEHAAAEVELRRAIELREQALGPEHPRVASSRSNLGLVLDAQGRHEEAEVEHQRALELAYQALGPEHPEAANMRNNIALGHYERGAYEEAEAEYREAMALQERTVGPEHPDAAQTRANLALLLNARGHYEEAEAEARRALAYQERALGAEHPVVATSRNNLGLVLHSRGKREAAEAEYRRALADYEMILGLEHPTVAQTRANLALTLQTLGRLEESEAEHRAGLAVLEKTLGSEHPRVALTRNNLSLVLYARGDHDGAVAEQRRALELQEAALGPEHPNVAMSHNNLAQMLLAQDLPAEAEAEQRKALAIMEKVLGPEHRNVAMAHNNLAFTLQKQDQLEEAEASFRRAVTVWEQVLDPQDLQLAASRHSLARLLFRRGQVEAAIPLLEQAWSRRKQEDTPPVDEGSTAFLLARARWRASPPGSRRIQDRALAERAQEAFVRAGDAYAWAARNVELWLAHPDRPLPPPPEGGDTTTSAG